MGRGERAKSEHPDRQRGLATEVSGLTEHGSGRKADENLAHTPLLPILILHRSNSLVRHAQELPLAA